MNPLNRLTKSESAKLQQNRIVLSKVEIVSYSKIIEIHNATITLYEKEPSAEGNILADGLKNKHS